MSNFQPSEILQQHRPLLLALETIGWLHMAGKAKIDFLQKHGGQTTNYQYEEWDTSTTPSFPWNDLLKWAQSKFPLSSGVWPDFPIAFLRKHTGRDKGLLGLLQAGHAMASGIEKQSYPGETVKYLGQSSDHMWLSSAFGHPIQNLLINPPGLLTPTGWQNFIKHTKQLLNDLKALGDPISPYTVDDLQGWWNWREEVIGIDPCGWLRRDFTSTLAETRLPNNDVTLFDQSYVAAALFKSAAAGALLEGNAFPWTNDALKQQTRWRLLTIGVGTDHYESRAIKIGDWTGMQAVVDSFFERVRKLVEVDVAVGSLLYKDSEVCVFSYPSNLLDNGKSKESICKLGNWLQQQADGFAHDADLELPPYYKVSDPSRSLVSMTKEIQTAKSTMAVPFHRHWSFNSSNSSNISHVCPVCLVRENGSAIDKQQPCNICKERRTHRLEHWLDGKNESDTIWISEVADTNDRVALITMSLDIEPWLDGSRLDSLRTQAIQEWRMANPTLKAQTNYQPNPIDVHDCFRSLSQYIEKKLVDIQTELPSFDENDPVLINLQEGYQHAKKKNDQRTDEEVWKSYFSLIVEDRADAKEWDELDNSKRAAWLVHQFFRKLASPGRIYRFQRQAEEFFNALLGKFRKVVSQDDNPWRTQRLVLKPKNVNPDWGKKDLNYAGSLHDAPVNVLYRTDQQDFITISNVGRILGKNEDKSILKGQTIQLKDDNNNLVGELVIKDVACAPESLNTYTPLIPLDLSPVRFRVLVPLETASNCVDHAVNAWNERFSRVWDRLPLRVGVVAFPRTTPFQAVIEAVRHMEAELDKAEPDKPEIWQVEVCSEKDGNSVLQLRLVEGCGAQTSDSEQKMMCRTIPVCLPDGGDDVFYPYLTVKDGKIRDPLDFQHPDGQVYRHAMELQTGDQICVHPARISTLFLDQTAKRFEFFPSKQLAEWERMRELWACVQNTASSQTALRTTWETLLRKREAWQNPDGGWLEGGKEAWRDLVRAMFHRHLELSGNVLNKLVEAAENGLLERTLEWHMNVLKEKIAGGTQ